MKNSDIKYQPLSNDESKSEIRDEESGLSSSGRSSPTNVSTKSSNILERFSGCSSKLTFFLVIAIFVALYFFTTLEVSLVDNRRSWRPTYRPDVYHQSEVLNQQPAVQSNQQYDKVFQQRLLKPFSNLLSKLSSSVNKLSQNANRNLSSILPARIQLNDSQTFKLAELESNLAATYWERWDNNFGGKTVPKKNVTYCDRVNMISPHQIKQNNLYWQVVKAPRVTQKKESPLKLYLYNAYLDNRIYGKPAVKVITTTDRQNPVETMKWWCLLWFENLRSPVLSKVSEMYTIWPEYWDFGVKDGIYGPQIATCDIPAEYANEVPQAISIQTTGECDKMQQYPDNVLRVIHNKRQNTQLHRPSIGVCVQAFRFGTYDVSVRLVEWLEMVKIMGADQVYFYVYGATKSVKKVLEKYKQEGFVNFRRLTLPGEQVNVESLYNYFYSKLGGKFWPQELLELNDCLYRNLYKHDYVAVFDIDEMIMPQKASNWHELIEEIRSNMSEHDRQTNAYYLNRHAYVYEMFEETEREPGKPIPEYLYMLRHTNRAELLGEGTNIKCFHRTDLVSAMHNHFPMRCLNTSGHHSCTGMTIDPKKSILMHYRRNRSPPEKCATPKDLRKCTIHDRTAWRFYDKLADNVKKQLIKIFS